MQWSKKDFEWATFNFPRSTLLSPKMVNNSLINNKVSIAQRIIKGATGIIPVPLKKFTSSLLLGLCLSVLFSITPNAQAARGVTEMMVNHLCQQCYTASLQSSNYKEALYFFKKLREARELHAVVYDPRTSGATIRAKLDTIAKSIPTSIRQDPSGARTPLDDQSLTKIKAHIQELKTLAITALQVKGRNIQFHDQTQTHKAPGAAFQFKIIAENPYCEDINLSLNYQKTSKAIWSPFNDADNHIIFNSPKPFFSDENCPDHFTTHLTTNLTLHTPGDYYIRVTAIDNYGGSGSLISEPITIYGRPEITALSTTTSYLGASQTLSATWNHPNHLAGTLTFNIKQPGSPTLLTLGSVPTSGTNTTINQTFKSVALGEHTLIVEAKDSHGRTAPTLELPFTVEPLENLSSVLQGFENYRIVGTTPLTADAPLYNTYIESRATHEQAAAQLKIELETFLSSGAKATDTEVILLCKKLLKHLEGVAEYTSLLGDISGYINVGQEAYAVSANSYEARAALAKTAFNNATQKADQGTYLAQWHFYSACALECLRSLKTASEPSIITRLEALEADLKKAALYLSTAQASHHASAFTLQAAYHKAYAELLKSIKRADAAVDHSVKSEAAALKAQEISITYLLKDWPKWEGTSASSFTADEKKAHANTLNARLLAYKQLPGAAPTQYKSYETALSNSGLLSTSLAAGQEGEIHLTLIQSPVDNTDDEALAEDTEEVILQFSTFKNKQWETTFQHFSVSNDRFIPTSAHAEALDYEIENDGQSLELESQGITLTLNPKGGLTLRGLEKSVTHLTLTSDQAVEVNGPDLTLTKLTLNAPTVTQKGALNVATLIINADAATCANVYSVQDLTLDLGQVKNSTLHTVSANNLTINAQHLTLQKSIQSPGLIKINAHTCINDAELSTLNLEVEAENFTHTNSLIVTETAYLKATHFKFLKNTAAPYAPSKISATSLTISGFESFLNEGTLGAINTDTASIDTQSLKFKGRHIDNKGIINGDWVTVELSNELINHGLISGRLALTLEADASITNHQNITGLKSLAIGSAYVINHGTLHATNGSLKSLKAGDWVNAQSGLIAANNLEAHFAGTWLNKGILQLGSIKASPTTIKNEGKIIIAGEAHLSPQSFINEGEKASVSLAGNAYLSNIANLTNQGTFIANSLLEASGTTFTNAGTLIAKSNFDLSAFKTFNNTGVIEVHGILSGSIHTLNNQGTLTLIGGMTPKVHNHFNNDGSLTCLGPNCHLTAHTIINNGKLIGTSKDESSDVIQSSDDFNLSALNTFANKGAIIGGKQTSLSASSKFSNAHTIGSNGPIAITSSHLTNEPESSITSQSNLFFGSPLTGNDASALFNNQGHIHSTNGTLNVLTGHFHNEGIMQIDNPDALFSINAKGSAWQKQSGILRSSGFFFLTADHDIGLLGGLISLDKGGKIESMDGNIFMKPKSNILSKGDLSITVEEEFDNNAGDIHVNGDFYLEADNIRNRRKDPFRVEPEPCAGAEHNCQGYKDVPTDKQPNVFVTGNATFKAHNSFKNDAGIIGVMGEIKIQSPAITNESQTLIDHQLVSTPHREKHGGLHGAFGGEKTVYEHVSRYDNKLLLGAITSNGNILIDMVSPAAGFNGQSWEQFKNHPHFKSNGHWYTHKNFNLGSSTKELIDFVHGLQNDASLKSAIAFYEPLSGPLLSNAVLFFLGQHGLKVYSKEENPNYLVSFDNKHERESFAAHYGVSAADLVQKPHTPVIVGVPAHIHNPLGLRHALDPVIQLHLMHIKYGPFLPQIESYIRKTQPGLLQDKEPITIQQFQQIAQYNSMAFAEAHPEFFTASITSLPGSSANALTSGESVDAVAQNNSHSTALALPNQHNTFIASEDKTAAIFKAIAADGRFILLHTVDNYNSEEFLLNLVMMCPTGFEAIAFRPEGLIEADQTLTLANIDHFSNTGTILSGAGISIDAIDFENIQRIHEHEETVYESKGLFHGTRSRTFIIKNLEPGGTISAVEISIVVENDANFTGGLIAAEHAIKIISKNGDVTLTPQYTTKIVNWDPGTMGKLKGKECHDLATYIHSTNFISDGTIGIEAQNILLKATHLLAREAIDIHAAFNIRIEGDHTKHKSNDSIHCHGLKCRGEQSETVISEPSILASQEGDVTLTADEGSITTTGSQVMAGGGITQIAGVDNIIDVEKIQFKSTSTSSGFDFFGYQHTKSKCNSEKVIPSYYIATGDIHFEAGRNNYLRAAIVDAKGTVEFISGEDTIIEEATRKTTIDTTSFSACLDFFGASALKALINKEGADVALKSIIGEDPLGRALLGLEHIGDWQDGLAVGTSIGVEAYRLYYALAKVNLLKDAGLMSPESMPTTAGALGQRVGLTDASGNFDPRLTLRLGVNKSTQTTIEVIEARVGGKNIYIKAGGDIWINGGAQVIAVETLELDAGGDIHMEPGKETSEFKSKGGGVSGSIGSGLAPSVGVDGRKDYAYALNHKHNHLKAGQKVIMRSKGGQYLSGTVVEAPEIDVKGKFLVIESVLDKTEHKSRGFNADTAGNVGGTYANGDSAWVNTVSGLYATQSLNVDIRRRNIPNWRRLDWA